LKLTKDDVKKVRKLALTEQDVQSISTLNLTSKDIQPVSAGAETVRVQGQTKVAAQVKQTPAKPKEEVAAPPAPPPQKAPVAAVEVKAQKAQEVAVQPIPPPPKPATIPGKPVRTPIEEDLPKGCAYAFSFKDKMSGHDHRVYGVEIPPCIRNVTYRPNKEDHKHGFNLSLAWPRTLWNVIIYANKSMSFAINRIEEPFIRNGLNTKLYLLGMPNMEEDGRTCTGGTLMCESDKYGAEVIKAINKIFNSHWNESIRGLYNQVGLEDILDWHTKTAKLGEEAVGKLKLVPAAYPTVDVSLTYLTGTV
jgi:hypothetical protein